MGRERLKQVLQVDPLELPLARAALLIAAEEYPDLDPRMYERRLGAMARAARAGCHPSDVGPDCLAAINDQMFSVEGFRGNAAEYYDPRNSFLNDVFDRRLGIPITLSIIYLELCWRTGVSAVGVGLPGHFIVMVDVGDIRYVDPFDRGAELDLPACVEKFRQLHGDGTPFHPSMLAPVTRPQILFRDLANLKNIYLRRQEFGRALAAIDRMLLLEPHSVGDYRDRGVICQKIGYFGQACSDFRSYIDLAPNAADANDVREVLDGALSRRAWTS